MPFDDIYTKANDPIVQLGIAFPWKSALISHILLQDTLSIGLLEAFIEVLKFRDVIDIEASREELGRVFADRTDVPDIPC